MKQFKIGYYLLTIYQIGSRHWWKIGIGELPIKQGHERSEVKAVKKAFEKFKDIVI